MKRGYLLFYNAFLAVAWLLVLVLWLSNGLLLDETGLLVLNIAQGLAILEVVHAAIKWVKAPVVTTFLQVFSRIFVLVLLNILPSDGFIIADSINALIPLLLAWGITEVFRYSYYFTSILNITPSWLTWIRYSTFLILYPLGVAGEFMIMYLVVEMNGFELIAMSITLGIIALSYIWGFPKMYGYMLSQRKKKL